MSCNKWKTVKLGDLIESISVRHKFESETVIFLNTSDILEGNILHNNYSSLDELPGQAKKSIQKHDILFSEIRPKNKRFAYVDFDAQDYVVSTKLMVLRKKDNRVNNKFLYKFLTSERTLDYLQAIAESRSGTFPQITFNELKIMDINLPPLEEQEKIANILCSLDDKIEFNNEMNKTLEEMAHSIFKRWFVDFEFPNENGQPYKSSGGEMINSELGITPKGWYTGTLDTISNVTMGVSPKSSSYNTDNIGVPLLNGASDFNETIINSTKHTTEPKKMCDKGDMVFCIRATIGNLTFADRDYCIGRGVASVKPKSKDYRELIYFSINNSIEKLISQASGSVFSNLTRDDINKMNVIIPNKEVLGKFSSITSNILEKIQNNNIQNEKLISIRDSILPKLMSGEIKLN